VYFTKSCGQVVGTPLYSDGPWFHSQLGDQLF